MTEHAGSVDLQVWPGGAAAAAMFSSPLWLVLLYSTTRKSACEGILRPALSQVTVSVVSELVTR